MFDETSVNFVTLHGCDNLYDRICIQTVSLAPRGLLAMSLVFDLPLLSHIDGERPSQS